VGTAVFVMFGLQIIAGVPVKPRTKPVSKNFPAGRLAAPFTGFPYLVVLVGFFLLTVGIIIPST
jgi:starvation-inducible outer membrane lipoprotein